MPKGSDAEDRQAVIDNAVQRNAAMLPRMWNRPGLRVDAPVKTEAKAFRR
jgi:hypothetical protein